MREFITVFGKIGCAARRFMIWGGNITEVEQDYARTTNQGLQHAERSKPQERRQDEFVETKRKIQRTEPRKVLNIQVLHSFQMKHLQPCQQ